MQKLRLFLLAKGIIFYSMGREIFRAPSRLLYFELVLATLYPRITALCTVRKHLLSKTLCIFHVHSCVTCPDYIVFLGLMGSVVGIGTRYGLDGPGIESQWGEIFHTCLDRPWGPPSLLYNGYRVFLGGKERPGREADPSIPLCL